MADMKISLEDRVDAHLLGTCFEDMAADPFLMAILAASLSRISLDEFIGEADALLDIQSPQARVAAFKEMLQKLVKDEPQSRESKQSLNETITL